MPTLHLTYRALVMNGRWMVAGGRWRANHCGMPHLTAGIGVNRG
jgi:hypothetical protein